MRRLCFVLVLCLIFSGCLSDSGGADKNAQMVISPTRKSVSRSNHSRRHSRKHSKKFNVRGVWVEINKGTPSELDILREGFPIWEPIVDYVAVTTAPGNASMYRNIKVDQRANNWESDVPIIPGLKPVSLFNCPRANNHAVCDLNQPDAWTQYAEELRIIISATQSKVVILENESLLFGYAVGEVEIDPLIIEEGLKKFPKGVTYYWYPPITSFYPNRRVRQTKLMKIVAKSLPGVRFVDLSHSRHSTVFRDFNGINRELNQMLSHKRLVNMIYVYPAQDFWRDDQVEQLSVEIFSNEELIYYPGQSGFVQQGQALSQRLRNRRSRP